MHIKLNHYSFTQQALEEPLELKAQSRRVIQTVESIAAGVAHHIDRGNLHTTISFAIKRIHSDAQQALSFTLMHPTQLLEVRGTLQVQNTSHRLSMPNALIESIECSAQGVVTTSRYKIVGGSVHQEALS